MLVKITKAYRDIVAICDSDLIGKKFEENEFQLDVKESFFSGEEFSKEKTIKVKQDMSRNDATFNIVGKNSINTALEAEIICEESIKRIQGIPFVLVLL